MNIVLGFGNLEIFGFKGNYVSKSSIIMCIGRIRY